MLDWLSAQELAGLPGMPGTVQGVNLRARKHKWEAQLRLGQGGGREYRFAVLPQETQAALLARMVSQQAPATAPSVPHVLVAPQRDGVEVSRLTDAQREVMTARVALIREVQRLAEFTTQGQAIAILVEGARKGTLSDYLMEQAERANDRKTADRSLSERTLKRWLSDWRANGELALAPVRRKPDMSVPSWAPAFLACYQTPQKPTVAAAYAVFKAANPGCPSIHAVHRWLGKLSPEAREAGRMGPRELKSLQAFKRRSTDMLWPNDVWVADGHTFDAEVINPLTGQIFRPEITMVIDWATRRIVGFSVNLAESTLATLDTLRDGVSRVGMYKVFYVDNGSGFDNATVYEVNDRLGGTITHSLPYNSQARGVIERAHRSILVTLAKTFDSYIGADMDGEAATRAHRLSRKQLAQGVTIRDVPTFDRFFADLQDALDRYNREPHRGLPKIRDMETGKRRHQSPMESWRSAEAEGWQALTADASVVASLTRPQVSRITHRGEVKFNSGIYFLPELVDMHGEEVRVGFDFRDSSRVWVHTVNGELIGEALLDGNATPAMPATLLERAAERRERGQLNRLVQKAKTLTGQQVEMHLVPKTAQPAELSAEQLADARHAAASLTAPVAPADAFQVPSDSMARYRLWKRLEARAAAGEQLDAEASRWHRSYPNTPEYQDTQDMFDFAAASTASA